MDPVFYALLAVVVALYAVFVGWRVRVHRGRRALASASSPRRGRGRGAPAEPLDNEARLARALEAAARIAGETPVHATTPPSPPIRPSTVSAERRPPAPGPHLPAADPVEMEQAGGPTTVAEMLQGIRLPADLAPLTTMASRPGAGDRVAFWTASTPAELAGPTFIDSLLAIGCTVARVEPSLYTIERDATRAALLVHPDGRLASIDGAPAFPSVPESAVVIEIWLPA